MCMFRFMLYRHDFSHNMDNFSQLMKNSTFFLHLLCFMANLFVCKVWMHVCHCHCVSGCALWRTVFSVQADIHLTDIGGDSSTVAYGNRLLTAKTWHQRKQVSQAWHSVLLRGLRDRLSAYSGIITPITSTLIPEKGEGSKTKYIGWS